MDQAAIGDFGGDSNRLDVYLDILAAIFDDSFQPVRFLRRERTRGAGEDKFSICFRGNARRLLPVFRRNHQREGLRHDGDLRGQAAGVFAIDLHVYALVLRAGELHVAGPQHGHSLHPRQPPQGHPREILGVRNGGAPLEQHRLEALFQQGHLAGNFEIAAIVPHFAEERERAYAVGAFRLHVELRQPPAQQTPPRHPVGEFPGARLQRTADAVHDSGVQPYPRHEQEVPGRTAFANQASHRDTPRPAFRQAPRGPLEIEAELHFRGQHIGGAARQDGQRNRGVDHAFGRFVDGAVASRHHHQIRPAADMLPRKGARGLRARGGRNRHAMPVLLEDFARAPDQRVSTPPESAGAGIVDEDGLSVGRYDVLQVPG